ncbi:hypothetical protein LFREDSHE_12100 [Shewanella baltica]
MKFKTNHSVLSQQEIKHCETLFSDNDLLVGRAETLLLNHREWLEGLMRAVEGKTLK